MQQHLSNVSNKRSQLSPVPVDLHVWEALLQSVSTRKQPFPVLDLPRHGQALSCTPVAKEKANTFAGSGREGCFSPSRAGGMSHPLPSHFPGLWCCPGQSWLEPPAQSSLPLPCASAALPGTRWCQRLLPRYVRNHWDIWKPLLSRGASCAPAGVGGCPSTASWWHFLRWHFRPELLCLHVELGQILRLLMPEIPIMRQTDRG